MYHDFPIHSFQCLQALDLAVVKTKLQPHGQIISFAGRGLRFIPDHRVWPPAYFNQDGTLDLVTKDLYMDDVLQFVEFLQKVLDIEIQGDV
jgi:hypothetical protein